MLQAVDVTHETAACLPPDFRHTV